MKSVGLDFLVMGVFWSQVVLLVVLVVSLVVLIAGIVN